MPRAVNGRAARARPTARGGTASWRGGASRTSIANAETDFVSVRASTTRPWMFLLILKMRAMRVIPARRHTTRTSVGRSGRRGS